MATLGGAEALGMDEQIGSLELGKQADLIAIDTRHPALQPLHSPLSQLVYTQCSSAVSHVWIDGTEKVRNGKLIDIDLNALYASAMSWQQRIAALR